MKAGDVEVACVRNTMLICMAVRELIVFQHDSELGCAPAWKLFEAVHVTRRDPGDPAPARSYQDYSVTVDEAALPAGITCRRMG